MTGRPVEARHPVAVGHARVDAAIEQKPDDGDFSERTRPDEGALDVFVRVVG
jgi:hypothetical protein